MIRRRDKIEALSVDIERGDFMEDRIYRGLEAKEHDERRLAENGNRMMIETKKLGKWRRWLAKVYLLDTGRALNEELIEKGWRSRLRNMLEVVRRGGKPCRH